jgi:ketosteroid isomerase-like protein
MSEAAIATLKRGHQAFNRGDAATTMELGTADVEWGATGKFPGLEKEYHGPEAMVQWMNTVRSVWDEFEVTLAEVLRDEGELIVVSERLRGRGRESGVEVEMLVYSAYWFEGGKVRRRRAFTESEEALAAAGLAGE